MTAMVLLLEAGKDTLELKLPAAKITGLPFPFLPCVTALPMASLIKVEAGPPPQELLNTSAAPLFHAQSMAVLIHVSLVTQEEFEL